MKRRTALLAAVVALALAFGMVGCGDSEADMEEETGGFVAAMDLDDNAPEYYPAQSLCPVCGGKPIKKDFYVETNKGRIYFDKKECEETFKGDKDKYMKEFQNQIDRDLSGGMPQN